MYHYRKTRKAYAKHNNNDKVAKRCPFPSCNPSDTQQKTVFENDTMYIIPNRVSYDVFEGRKVSDHLMVIPKRHVENLKDFTNQEKIDTMNIVGEYEANGYNVYARGVGSKTRSVKHQHTHLIKLDDKTMNLLVFVQKPYFLMKF